MKKMITRHWSAGWFSIGAAAVVLLSGCAAPQQYSYNHDFGENAPTDPKYYIQDRDETHFTITVQQGRPSTGAERVLDLKHAAPTIAKAECQRRGWEKWNLDYIQDRDQGWMHVVVAEVRREKYVAPTYPGSNSNP